MSLMCAKAFMTYSSDGRFKGRSAASNIIDQSYIASKCPTLI